MSEVKQKVSHLNPEVGKHIAVLRSIAGQIIGTGSYLEAINEVTDTSKLNDSFSGHTVQMLRSATAHSGIMAVCRFWDKNLPLKTAKTILSFQNEISNIRSSEHPDFPPDALQEGTLSKEIQETIILCEELLSDEAYKKVRVYRTEYLAHNSYKPSRDRIKHFGQKEAPAPRYGDVVDISKKSLTVLDRMISHWEFHVELSMDSFEIQKSYAKMFWHALPKFEEKEDIGLIYDPM